MALIQIATPFNIDIEFELAAFHKRLLAYLIDFILMFLYLSSMRALLLKGLEVGESGMGFSILIMLLPPLFYTLLTELLMNGQTVGKKLMNIKVVSLDGGEPTLGQYMLRWFMRFYEWGGFIVFTLFWGNGIGGLFFFGMGGIASIVIMALTAKSQRLGDLVAGTVVVNTESKLTVDDTIFMHVNQQHYQPAFPEVMKLSDRDINTIKSVIQQAKKTNRYDMCNKVAVRVQEVLKVSADMYAIDFLEKLMEDYNYLSAFFSEPVSVKA